MKYLIKFLKVVGISVGMFLAVFLVFVTLSLSEAPKIIAFPVMAIGLFLLSDFFENHTWWKIRAWEQKNLAHGKKLKRFFKRRVHLSSDEICKVGPFDGKFVVQSPIQGGLALLSSARPLTVEKRLSVDIPPIGDFRFRISGEQISRADWMRWQSSGDLSADVIAALAWDVPEPLLRQTLQTPEAIWCLFHLFLLGKGEISCENGVFSVHIVGPPQPWSERRHGCFFSLAKALIRIYARVARLKLPEWHFLQNNDDCWDGEDEIASDVVSLQTNEKSHDLGRIQ